MTSRIVDVRDLNDLSNALGLVLFFTEYVNTTASAWIRKNASTLEPRGETQIPQLKFFLSKAEVTFADADKQRHIWPSELVALARSTGIQPIYQESIIRELVKSMSDPPKVGAEQRLDTPQPLDENLFVYRLPEGHGFASRPVLDREALKEKNFPLLYWDEALNPISTLQAFLMDVLGEGLYSADHYIQAWLRHAFDLHYEQSIKYRLMSVCGRFNELFYDSPSPSHQRFHTKKSSTVGISVVIHEVARILAEDDAGAEAGPIDPASLRRALGIYLFFRFCRQLRCRYQSLLLKPGQRSSLSAEDFDLLRTAVEAAQCVSALRPLQPTYFQTRMFGALSAIPGLNDVLRGGMLPRAASGRTFTVIGSSGAGKTVLALQVMTDIARQGRLAVYFSFEESYDSILDRLVTFQLYDPEKFDVIVAGQDIAGQLRERYEAQPRRGLLVLYKEESTAGPGATYDLPSAISGIANAAGDYWKWRALTIDSLNALEFNAGSQDFGRRLDLQVLIRTIEESRFLGIVLSERGSSEFDVFTYLSDTVVELGVDAETRARWLEIRKCRTQDYHPGRHQFRIVDGGGIRIYPSLPSRMSSLRRRMRATLSERRSIPLPLHWERLGLQGLKEKSSTLISGPAGAGKTVLMLQLATTPSQFDDRPKKAPKIDEPPKEPKRRRTPQPPANVLLLTFRTSELNVLQSLRHHDGLYRRWKEIRRTQVRWFSPGSNLTGDQIISELWGYIHQSRREGIPLERILFDEIEMAEEFLPGLKRDSLFWPTLLELVATEAITSFFVSSDKQTSEWLGATMDYIFHVDQGGKETGWHRARLEKNPALWMHGPSLEVDFQIDPKTGIIEGRPDSE